LEVVAEKRAIKGKIMIGTIKIGVFALGLLWIMQHVAPEKLPYSLRPSGYSEWGSGRPSMPQIPSMAEGVSKVQEGVQGLTTQILKR
jgi:hypothetical protein